MDRIHVIDQLESLTCTGTSQFAVGRQNRFVLLLESAIGRRVRGKLAGADFVCGILVHTFLKKETGLLGGCASTAAL